MSDKKKRMGQLYIYKHAEVFGGGELVVLCTTDSNGQNFSGVVVKENLITKNSHVGSYADDFIGDNFKLCDSEFVVELKNY